MAESSATAGERTDVERQAHCLRSSPARTSARRVLRALAAVALVLVGCRPTAAESLTVTVVRQLAHDPDAFTQGLEFDGDTLYESTGLVGRSSVREVDLESGEVVRIRELPLVFAEGLTVVGSELLQLTWRDGVLYRWDKQTFEPTGSARYSGEGWGLCFDGEALWMSDGSSRLTRRDPATFAVLRTLEVKREGEPVSRLNELECVGEDVYANVFTTDQIVRIDADSGAVTATVDASPLRELLPSGLPLDAVLNGIAYDEARDLFLLTGKLWPSAFEVRFVAAPSD